jgi:hypothetical protein
MIGLKLAPQVVPTRAVDVRWDKHSRAHKVAAGGLMLVKEMSKIERSVLQDNE